MRPKIVLMLWNRMKNKLKIFVNLEGGNCLKSYKKAWQRSTCNKRSFLRIMRFVFHRIIVFRYFPLYNSQFMFRRGKTLKDEQMLTNMKCKNKSCKILGLTFCSKLSWGS